MDRDGDLDLYIARYLQYRPGLSKKCEQGKVPVYCHPRFFPGEPDLLYKNRGDGTFEEVGRQAGIAKAGDHEGKGLGVAAFDFDRDGWIDVYVANDTTPNFLWRNNGDGTFTDLAHARGAALSADGRAQAGMGVDVADANGDGWTDIYVSNFSSETNALYLGSREGVFIESCRRANLGKTFSPLGFGTLFVDVDLDGDPDLVTANGHVNDLVEATDPDTGSTYRQRPSLFLNDGKGVFEEAADRGGPFFSQPVVGRGLASADFDNDGDIDLAFMTIDRSLVLLRNENPAGNRSLTVKLEGRRSPRDGTGARLEAEAGGKRQVFEYSSGRSYLSACDPRAIIGAGQAREIDRLTIHWPSGKMQVLEHLPARGQITIAEPE